MKLIPLTKGLFAIIDDSDYELVSQFTWHATKGASNRGYYARMTERGSHATRRHIYLHRFLLGLRDAPRSVMADHRNGNTLDNRRENLRTANATQNGGNRAPSKSKTGFKGVSVEPHGYRARFGKGPGSTIGTFKTPEEAAVAYDAAAKRYFGDFARLNFPEAA